MAIIYEKLMNLEIPTIEQTYTQKDTMLYALGVGLGQDPTDREQLRFVYEQNLKALPTQAVVLAHPGLWVRDLDTGIDYVKVVHGEQGLVLHKPLPPSGTVLGISRVTGVFDKGEGKGALVLSERKIVDKSTGDLLATITQNTFCRGDGGFGGPSGPTPAPHVLPEREADMVCDLATVPQAALIYRLNADMNPLHADPDIAAKAGFAQPILHGLATYGVSGHAVLKSVCGYDPARLKSLNCRFTAPVYPGETFRTEIWIDGTIVSFRTRSLERDIVAISNGRAEIAG
ncbi:MaoC/PaaZ C-terminal domain-containing protein [Rhizobium sp. C4]|uniref:MaoC/PaaZ C-terminal domain-containing protein n=1 Tax=Rhizobium sp. C4 TaxID=1349800 RepID=UPI001E4D06E5|nr:MaoC/PaaZ C-terminal domain-containing protein [Rhizobium sp. C4]MCD2172254.1 3-alpha,7-alpha,12-alpha-trihydroxy-5-beta-cholest-24-enoyl-CoA hydratase [Rhizobium sp. C4]